MKIRVIYPVRPDWRETEERTFDVGEVEAETPEAACEQMFNDFNVAIPGVTGRYNDQFKCRSLSVGDIVEVDGVRYRCVAMGFREMGEEEKNEFRAGEMFS